MINALLNQLSEHCIDDLLHATGVCQATALRIEVRLRRHLQFFARRESQFVAQVIKFDLRLLLLHLLRNHAFPQNEKDPDTDAFRIDSVGAEMFEGLCCTVSHNVTDPTILICVGRRVK